MKSDKDILLENISKVHTTDMGIDRIKRNLDIDGDVVSYCIAKINNKSSEVTRKGKNYYVAIDNLEITINAYSYTIITAKKIKGGKYARFF